MSVKEQDRNMVVKRKIRIKKNSSKRKGRAREEHAPFLALPVRLSRAVAVVLEIAKQANQEPDPHDM